MLLARLHRVCNRMVDLPIPGSPPISTTEPSTRPPPRTRSSSPEAVEKRGISSMLTSAKVLICACCPAQPVRPVGAVAPPLSIMVSVRVFQAPHSPHWPAHLGKVAPHSVQPYMRLALAIRTPDKNRDDNARADDQRGAALRISPLARRVALLPNGSSAFRSAPLAFSASSNSRRLNNPAYMAAVCPAPLR
ncbi:hypothetical protein D3C84_233850 [compost metagenome]